VVSIPSEPPPLALAPVDKPPSTLSRLVHASSAVLVFREWDISSRQLRGGVAP
jgi:hypothetical protein